MRNVRGRTEMYYTRVEAEQIFKALMALDPTAPGISGLPTPPCASWNDEIGTVTMIVVPWPATVWISNLPSICDALSRIFPNPKPLYSFRNAPRGYRIHCPLLEEMRLGAVPSKSYGPIRVGNWRGRHSRCGSPLGAVRSKLMLHPGATSFSPVCYRTGNHQRNRPGPRLSVQTKA